MAEQKPVTREELAEALRDCVEALCVARDRLGICGFGDGKDRKADADDVPGSLFIIDTCNALFSRLDAEKEQERSSE